MRRTTAISDVCWISFSPIDLTLKQIRFLLQSLDQETAAEALTNNAADTIVFGSPFIANPGLVERFRRGSGLNLADSNTVYTPGETGYTDYPALVA